MSDEGSLQSTLQSVDHWNGTWEDAGGERADLVREYLPLFYATFPQAGKRLIPAALDEDDARGRRAAHPHRPDGAGYDF